MQRNLLVICFLLGACSPCTTYIDNICIITNGFPIDIDLLDSVMQESKLEVTKLAFFEGTSFFDLEIYQDFPTYIEFEDIENIKAHAARYGMQQSLGYFDGAIHVRFEKECFSMYRVFIHEWFHYLTLVSKNPRPNGDWHAVPGLYGEASVNMDKKLLELCNVE